MKRISVVVFVAFMAVFAVFAGGATEEAQSTSKQVRVALITNPMGTSDYINLGIEGFKASCAKWGIHGDVIECKGTAEYEENSRAAANEGYDLILGGSWEAGSILSELADTYDGISFGILDTLTASDRVKCIQYTEGEGAYLIGVLAALTTDGTSHNYGCICVNEGAGSWKWRYGYAQGVLSVDPQARFVFNYVYGYSEVNLAYEIALQQYELGCKFINSCAAGGDIGTFAAAKEKGFYTAGQDSDLTTDDNPWIVSCQLKGAGESISFMIDEFMNNNWNSDNDTLGVADGAIGAVWATMDSTHSKRPASLSDDDIAQLKEVVRKLSVNEINMKEIPEESTVVLPLIGR